MVSTNENRTTGFLIIQSHSCKMHFCNEMCSLCDCTCGIAGKRCIVRSNDTSKLKTYNHPQNASIDINISMNTTDKGTTGSSLCLKANWTYLPKSYPIHRFEYSFGIIKHGSVVGEGIYNTSIENPWHDVGKRQNVFYCLQNGELSHGSHYVAFIRAWISSETYLTATSNPIVVDHTPPVLHKRRYIKDSTNPCEYDVDFIRINTSIFGCWEGVFTDDESGIEEYMVSLGTSPGGILKVKTNMHARLNIE